MKKKKISAREWIEIIMSFSKKIKYDHVSSFAGHAALFLLMSLFPMVMYFISVFQYISLDAGMVLNYVKQLLPDSLIPLFNQIIQEAYSGSTTAIQSFSMLVMLFCASKGVYAVIIGNQGDQKFCYSVCHCDSLCPDFLWHNRSDDGIDRIWQ